MVLLHFGDDGGMKQPDGFRCCPLGCQLYTPNAMTPYQLIKFCISLENCDRLECQGVVVNSEFQDEESLYKSWVYFLDLPDDTRDSLEKVTQDLDLTCPYCENF